MAASDTSATEEEAPAKGGSGASILIGLGLAAVLGSGGFFAVYQGLLPIPGLSGAEEQSATDEAAAPMPIDAAEFLALDPMVVSLGTPGRGRHLRFRAEVEVQPGRSSEVQAVMPRIQDTLNGYLRAVPIEELEAPSALVQLRSQMLRRVQLVTPQGTVRDLLIVEFVLN